MDIATLETVGNQETGVGQQARFVRITNLPTDKSTVKKLSRAGRLRWKIENVGFNEQKNNGYAMEHLFCRKSFTAFQNYYQCLLMHILSINLWNTVAWYNWLCNSIPNSLLSI